MENFDEYNTLESEKAEEMILELHRLAKTNNGIIPISFK